MNGKGLSGALSGLPEDMIAEAMEPARKARTIPWLRIAVCFAAVLAVVVSFFCSETVISAPGILTMRVYATDGSGDSVVLSEPLEGVMGLPGEFYYHPAVGVPGVPIVLYVADSKNVTFQITADGGTFMTDREDPGMFDLPIEFLVENGHLIYWKSVGRNGTSRAGKVAYADVLIWQDGHVVGFALIAFDGIYDEEYGFQGSYAVRLVESVYYPRVLGVYQKITEEYAREQIQAIKDADRH